MKKQVNAYSSFSPNIGDQVICNSAIQVLKQEGIIVDRVMPALTLQNPLYEDFRFSDVNIVVGHPLYGLNSFSAFLSAVDRYKASNGNSRFYALGLGLRGSLKAFNDKDFDLSSFDAIATRDDDLFIHLNAKYQNIFKSACLSYFLDSNEFTGVRSNSTALVFPVMTSYAQDHVIKYGLEYWRNLFRYLRSELNIQEIDIGLVDSREILFFKQLCDEKTRCLTFSNSEQLKLIGEYNLIVSARLHMAISASRYCSNLKIIPIDYRISQLLNYSEEKNKPYLPPKHKRNILSQRKAIFNQNDFVDFLDKHRYDPEKNIRFPKHIFREIKALLTDPV
tara:strand:- start:8011 stop:9015 length:1005 start_codon:yes stop_codon:yes gene_type:complete